MIAMGVVEEEPAKDKETQSNSNNTQTSSLKSE